MHDTFLKNVVSMERTWMKAISMPRLIFELQLCISIATTSLAHGEEGSCF